MEADPKNPMAHNDLGYTRELLCDMAGAVAAYDAALELNMDFAAAKANRDRARKRLDHLAPPPREKRLDR